MWRISGAALMFGNHQCCLSRGSGQTVDTRHAPRAWEHLAEHTWRGGIVMLQLPDGGL